MIQGPICETRKQIITIWSFFLLWFNPAAIVTRELLFTHLQGRQRRSSLGGKRQGLRGATGRPWEEAAGLGDLVAGHGEQAAGRGGHRRKTGADNGEPRRRKEKEMEKQSNGDRFVRRDISRRREQRDLPLGGGGYR